jgi:hypothetical protein
VVKARDIVKLKALEKKACDSGRGRNLWQEEHMGCLATIGIAHCLFLNGLV